MNYTPITEENVEKAATLYMNHYNQHSGGCWTYEKAYKRIRQMVTMEDSLCLCKKMTTIFNRACHRLFGKLR